MTPIPANIYKRLLAIVLDHLAINLILLIIYLKFISKDTGPVHLDTNTFILFVAFSFLYFIFFEGLLGWTPGKKIFKLQVVSQTGNRASISSVLLRNLLRPLDFTGFYLLGFIFISYTRHSQRIGDLLAHTKVVESLD